MSDFNPFLAEFRANPYPFYARMRDQDPVQWHPYMQAWILTRYSDIQAVLRDSARFSSNRRRARNQFVQQMVELEERTGPLGRAQTMLGVDPPEHTRMRGLVNKAFTPRMVEKMRPRIQAIAEELLDHLPDRRRVDVVKDLADRLPVIVIAEMLGVSPKDRARFKAWSDDIASTLGTAFLPSALDRGRKASADLAEYFRKAIARHRKEPADDLLSGLIQAEERGDLFSEDELLAACILLLVAGNETTTNLIGNGMLALMRHPDEMRRLQADPALVPGAVEELLRYDSPVQATSRVALADMEVGGKPVSEGQFLITLLGAANRDPEQFPDPDRLDLGREDNRHLSFGYGIHFCVGAPLARVEAQTAIAALLRRFPDAEPDVDQPPWKPSFILRGMESLPITSRVAARR